ncbi:longitudinals lacking protein, isoforms H/M/V-like [Culicoides brevitarsis]|uniref:longitudinals lacking protein, isoforms H/M/V-like n=1 Tax=Culicoides brevitarsis TaxID=469753 RepID=UPI00307CA472
MKIHSVQLHNEIQASTVSQQLFHDTKDENSLTYDLLLQCGPDLFEFRCHKAIFAASSEFLWRMLEAAMPYPCPVVLLPDIRPQTMRYIIEFVYNGEIRVPLCEYADFVEGCELLELKGLKEERDSESDKESEMSPKKPKSAEKLRKTSKSRISDARKSSSSTEPSDEKTSSGDELMDTDSNDDGDTEKSNKSGSPRKLRRSIKTKRAPTNTILVPATPENISVSRNQVRDVIWSLYASLKPASDEKTKLDLQKATKATKLVLYNKKIWKARHDCGFCGRSLSLFYQASETRTLWHCSGLRRHLRSIHKFH